MTSIQILRIMMGTTLCCWGLAASAAPLDTFFSDPFDTQAWLSSGAGAAWSDHALKLPTATRPNNVHFTHRMTLAQLTAYALRHNPATEVAYANLQASAAGLGVATSGYLPTLTLTSSANRSQQNSTAGFAIPALNADSTSLSLSYVLLDFGARAAQRNAAKAQLFISGFDNNLALQNVSLSVTQNYYQLIGEQALVRAYRQTVAEDLASLNTATIQQKSGMATISDVLQAKAALAQAKAELISARAQVRSDQGALAESCGLSADNPIPLQPLNPQVLPPIVTPAVQTLIHYAISHNASVSADAAQILADRADVQSDQAVGLPTLSLGVSGGKRFQNQLSPSQNWSIGVTLTVPIFSGFKDSYQVEEARSQVNSAQASLNEEAQTVSLTVYQDYQTVLGAREAAQAAQLAVASAQASLKAVRAQYKVGLATMVDLLTAQATLTTAQQTQIQDITTGYIDLANLANALGYIEIPHDLTSLQDQS
ncbi:TolC family protein [Acidithiobacillus sp. HP-11]|uniref:TolC family protein n=1 Tax=Acidithiobacillus sp. HP-11 TaxID=2697656 RepID=UPI0029D41B26|nr:TolC family protein [Acidithiobacillus sp. HP-11]